MKWTKTVFSASQVKALLKKDVLVRWRQPWMSIVQVLWPCLVFMLLYLIRLKFGPEDIEDCQFPTRQLPTKSNVLPSFYSYICSIENKCTSTKHYEEYSRWESAPMKPAIDIINAFVSDDRMFNAIVELPAKANFISFVTSIVAGGHFDTIRKNIGQIIDLIPQIERVMNGTFDIKRMFSDRNTFVKAGYLMCGHPFPSTDTIPLVNDILYDTEDFSKINDNELRVMPTPYCKRLYLDITSTNHGKLTWNVVKPVIHGKILYGPSTTDTDNIMRHANFTFEEVHRLQRISVAVNQVLAKLRGDPEFQKGFDSLLKLATTPLVKTLIGDEINVDQLVVTINRLRTDPVVYDVVVTVKSLLECFSVDRMIPLNSERNIRRHAFELNQKRLFYAAVFFNNTEGPEVSYKLHMDTENTQPTIENKNRFWFPGPARSMVRDLKYHRGFVQIKHSIDMGIIKHKATLWQNSTLTAQATTEPQSQIQIELYPGSGEKPVDENANAPAPGPVAQKILLKDQWWESEEKDEDLPSVEVTTKSWLSDHTHAEVEFVDAPEVKLFDMIDLYAEDEATPSPDGDEFTEKPDEADEFKRKRRQTLTSLFSIFESASDALNSRGFEGLKLFTKQFPYPAYIHDDFRTGLYLAQAIQVSFFLGLVAQIASCVRHLIWMRESRNTLIMCSMGMSPCSELFSWAITTSVEVLIIFLAVSLILYTGGILIYTSWFFIMFFLIVFGCCLISFCHMCSTFFTSATIGAVATALLFFISYCPYIIVLLFDAHLSSLQTFLINLSFTTAFSTCWSHIMRLELQQTGMTIEEAFHQGTQGDFGFGFFMIIFDMIIYLVIGHLSRHLKYDEYRFIEVEREYLDSHVGAILSNVSKVYDDKVAVSNINLSLLKNKVTCLLGRNGAGKSTIIKMLTGQVVQTAGRVLLPRTAYDDDHDKVGVCAQDNILIPNLTAREHLELYARMKMKRDFTLEVDRTLMSLKFDSYESYQAAQLSGGYQRRLCVALAFIGSPNVVILDEPCNGVDSKARKDIWMLIERLRKGRAVVLATHFLDEAEYLSDLIVIMKDGKIVAKHNPETLKAHCTSNFDVSMQCCDSATANEINATASTMLTDFRALPGLHPGELRLQISYDQQANKSVDFFNYLQNLQEQLRINNLHVESQNLEQLFRDLDDNRVSTSSDGSAVPKMTETKKQEYMTADDPLDTLGAVRQLFWKRLVHFSRNYRMLLCVIVMPAILEILAMWFVTYRLEDDYDNVLSFSRELYPNSLQTFSIENNKTYTSILHEYLRQSCKETLCIDFPNSKDTFFWILESVNQYRGKRYGAYTFNDTNSMIWYNNKGYHAMMGWLNDFNTALLQVETDTNHSITCYNEPWKLGFTELTTSSVLRQSGDAAMALILLIAFSMVVAVGSVYLVNERMSGEKLQQTLCGVSMKVYWTVSYIWDLMVLILAILVCVSIILAFGMPIFVDRQQLWGIIVLALFFGFASIPAVHVFEKCFTDSSVAIVTIFCMNIIIPLLTMAIIVLLGVVGDSPEWDSWRYFLNRAFLVFPQHALGDGLLEICKNYMVALVFHRYDIDSYKNPIYSNLLIPHLLSLLGSSISFTLLNIMIEKGWLYQLKESLVNSVLETMELDNKGSDELKVVSIQNLILRSTPENPQVLKVDNLCKYYKRGQYAVKNVTFSVKSGECLGLMGKNGAGKSTIFKLLSGQLYPTSGEIYYMHRPLSYCPQTNPLDSLLTVEQVIKFYGNLRRVRDVAKLLPNILESFQLESYRYVLVKNLSGGNRRKLTVATTCMGLTSVVLMDEPTSDMDPLTRGIVYRTIQELLAADRAIVLTSHSLSEIDEICHRIAVLKEGRMVTYSTPDTLREQYGGFYTVAVYCEPDLFKDVIKTIQNRFPQYTDLQIYLHCIKFNVKIDIVKVNSKQRESGIDIPIQLQEKEEFVLTLADLFSVLNALSLEYGGQVRYAVNCCRLDSIFERILDANENPHVKERPLTMPRVVAPVEEPEGIVHQGYVETETTT